VTDPLEVLDEIDLWGEWRNAGQFPDVVEALAAMRPSYAESAGYFRALRPDNPHEAALWWSSPETLAHFLNALLKREDRTIMQVEADLALPRWKIHHYLRDFGIAFRARPRHRAPAIFPDGLEDVVRILEARPQGRQIWARVRDEERRVWEGTWSRSSWAFRLRAPVVD